MLLQILHVQTLYNEVIMHYLLPIHGNPDIIHVESGKENVAVRWVVSFDVQWLRNSCQMRQHIQKCWSHKCVVSVTFRLIR